MNLVEENRNEAPLKACRKRRLLHSAMAGLSWIFALVPASNTGSGTGNSWRMRCRGEEGGPLVEIAFVIPVFMLMITGIFSFGITLNNYLVLTDAVGIGARYVALQSGQVLDPCATAVSKIEQAAPNLKPANLTFTFVLNGTSYPGTSCSSSSYTTGAAGNLVSGQPAQVTVSYPCSLAVYGRNLVPSCTLVAQTTEIVQ